MPLAPAPAAASPALNAVTHQSASRAQELGFPTVAAELYRELLSDLPSSEAGAGLSAQRDQLTLALATALLDDDRPEEAQHALASYAGPRGTAWHLRAALADLRLGSIPNARLEEDAIKPGELAPADRPWHFFVQAALAGAAGDPGRAGALFGQAEAAATTDLEKARFQLEREKQELVTAPASAVAAEQARRNAERFQGTATGFDFARSYAVMLDALGNKAAAEGELRNQLLMLPPQERIRADDFRLLMGLIAGAGDPAGQGALTELLESGSDPNRRRIALQLLATASQHGPDHAAFEEKLGKLIAAGQGSTADPILDDLLLFRAQWALDDHDHATAEDNARVLLEKFPGSPLKGYAWSVLTGSAWEQRRYRTAADDAFQARGILGPGEARAELGVVVAEAWYRAGDFRSAADAYWAVLQDPPAFVRPGALMFQLVKSDIEADRAALAAGTAASSDPLRDARLALDTLASNPAFDPVDRWEAEWNYASALQKLGQNARAYERLNRLLTERGAGTSQLPADLRARLGWLEARLSLDAGQPAETLRLVDAMTASLGGIAAELREDIGSTGLLLKAEASFRLNRDADALDILERLRADFPHSSAAVESYIVEADHYADTDNIVRAEELLIKLADDFPARADYAPYALLHAARLAQRLGQDKNLREADALIERLVTTYPQSPLVFDARLTQGDILRELDDFPKAQEVYESLRNNYSGNPDAIYAELDLAECHNAQSASDPSHAQTAISLFADLRDRVDAPVDVRVEAGFNLGYLYSTRGQPAQAQAIWWRDVVSAFLLDPQRAKALGSTGRYWMTRTLIELGDLCQRAGQQGEARRAWELILSTNLPGAGIARDRLKIISPTGSQNPKTL